MLPILGRICLWVFPGKKIGTIQERCNETGWINWAEKGIAMISLFFIQNSVSIHEKFKYHLNSIQISEFCCVVIEINGLNAMEGAIFMPKFSMLS